MRRRALPRLPGPGRIDVPKRPQEEPAEVAHGAESRGAMAGRAHAAEEFDERPFAKRQYARAHHGASGIRALVEVAVESRGVPPEVEPRLIAKRLGALQEVLAALRAEAQAVAHELRAGLLRIAEEVEVALLHGEFLAQGWVADARLQPGSVSCIAGEGIHVIHADGAMHGEARGIGLGRPLHGVCGAHRQGAGHALSEGEVGCGFRHVHHLRGEGSPRSPATVR